MSIFRFPMFDSWDWRWVRETRREKVRRMEALLMEAELEVLRLEVLPLNSILPEKVQLVALQLKEVQLVEFEWWPFQGLHQKWQFKYLLPNLLRRVELILAELRLREEPRERRCRELIRRLWFLAILWQRLLESLLFSGNVSEFPNKHRPPCTTMPWNIRPALVVLWGVCWMFNPWSPIDDIQLQPLSADEQTLFSSGKVFPHSNVHFVQLTFSTQILTMN